MTPEMITAAAALLSGIGGIVAAILLNRKTMVLLEYRMGQVEKKLDSHNGYAKMFSETSKQIAEISKDVAVIKTKMEYLEKET